MSELLFFILGGGLMWLYCVFSVAEGIQEMSVSEFKEMRRHLKGEPSFMERQANYAREFFK